MTEEHRRQQQQQQNMGSSNGSKIWAGTASVNHEHGQYQQLKQQNMSGNSSNSKKWTSTLAAVAAAKHQLKRKLHMCSSSSEIWATAAKNMDSPSRRKIWAAATIVTERAIAVAEEYGQTQ
ncbi:hypothetical protein PoB_003344600 [Plakobranchus ocellatus]|uniref:Uncharacterized protein n=1 Tax=Plakobranchus ocellatus TaxID=259542 RepID=A0AAV4A6U7_9GAST|nr:hypothetical protein PoB_003344600 [Plakobranchus ocellatus]